MPQANDNHITPTRRQRIEDTIERLISVLDAADAPAEDLELIGDEADTGWPERHGAGGQYCTAAASEDDEPELGWTGDIDQTRAHRHYQERWAEGDPREVEADYVGFYQGHYWQGFTADMEASNAR